MIYLIHNKEGGKKHEVTAENKKNKKKLLTKNKKYDIIKM